MLRWFRGGIDGARDSANHVAFVMLNKKRASAARREFYDIAAYGY
jgi:hypothetical protein